MSHTTIGATYSPTTTNSTAHSDICVSQTEESIRMKTAYSTSKKNYWFRSKNAFARFQASTTVLLRSSLFRGFTLRWLVLVYWRFGTSYRSHLHGVKQSKNLDCLTPRIWTAWLHYLWKWDPLAVPKRRLTHTKQRCVKPRRAWNSSTILIYDAVPYSTCIT